MKTSYHRSDFVKALQIFHNLRLVGRLDAGKAAGVRDCVALSLRGQLVELSSGERHKVHIVVFGQDADAAADCHSRALVVAGDHDNSDAGLTAQHDGGGHFLSGRVEHADAADKGEVRLEAEEPKGKNGERLTRCRKDNRTWKFNYLVLCELGSVRKDHVLYFGWVVSCGESEAPQGVVACPVLTDHRHDLFPNACGERDLVVSKPDVSTSLNNPLWGSLMGPGGEESVEVEDGATKRPSPTSFSIP